MTIRIVFLLIAVLCGSLLYSDRLHVQDICASNLNCWTTANRPVNPAPGTFGYNLNLNTYEFFNGSVWEQTSAATPPLIHVASNVLLKSTTGGSVSVIVRDGFAASGDGGQATYTWSGSACTIAAGAGDNGYQVKPDVGTGCWIAQIGVDTDMRLWGTGITTGCGTPGVDETACWDAIEAAVATGLRTTIACTGTTYVNQWALTTPLYIRGNGSCKFTATAAATQTSDMIDYRATGSLTTGSMTFENVDFVAPMFPWFLSVFAGGSGYTANASGQLTWASGGTGVCSTAPKINVTTDSSGVVNAATSYAVPGSCTVLPRESGAVWNASASLGAGTGAVITLVYRDPPVNKFFRAQGPTATNGPSYNINFNNVTFYGAQTCTQTFGVVFIEVRNFYSYGQTGSCLTFSPAAGSVGSAATNTEYMRIIDGTCQVILSYCWSFPNGNQVAGGNTQAPRKILVSNVMADFCGFGIFAKYCGDLVADTLIDANIQFIASNGRSGCMEAKGDPAGSSIPVLYQGISVDMKCTNTWDIGYALAVNHEQFNTTAPVANNTVIGSNYRVNASWYAPAAWQATTGYSRGQSVTANGYTFIAGDSGISGATAPKATGATAASVAVAGTGYTISTSGDFTYSAGGGGVCTTVPVVNANTNVDGGVSSVNYIVTPGVCTTFPVAAGSTWTSTLGGANATFTLTICNNGTPGNSVLDGTVIWVCVEATPAAAVEMGAAQVESVSDANIEINGYQLAEGISLLPKATSVTVTGGYTENTIRNLTVKINGTFNTICALDRVSSDTNNNVGIITNLNIIAPSCTCGRTDGAAGGTACINLGHSDSSGNTNIIDATISGGIVKHIGNGLVSSNRGTAIACTGTAGVSPTVNLSVVGTRLTAGLGAYNINGCNWTSTQAGGTMESTDASNANDVITLTEPVIANTASVVAGGSGYTASTTGTLTWGGAGCTTNPVMNATTNSSGVITSLTVTTPPVCNTWPPVSDATNWTAGGLGAGTGVQVNLVHNNGTAEGAINTGGTGYGATVTGLLTWAGTGCTTNPILVASTNSSGVLTTINNVQRQGVCATPPNATTASWTPSGGLSAGSNGTVNYLISTAINIKTLGPVATINARTATKAAWSTNGVGAASATIISGGITHGVSATGTLTWQSGGTCSTAPVITASTSAGQVVNAIGSVLIPGVCTVFPTAAAVWRAGGGLTASADDVTLTLVPNVVVAGRFVAAPTLAYPSAVKCNWGEEIPIDPNTQLFTGVAGATGAPIATGSYICALPGTSRQWLGGIQLVGTAAEATRIPACSAALTGLHAFVTDQATAAAYMGVTSSGAGIAQRILCDGTNWIQD